MSRQLSMQISYHFHDQVLSSAHVSCIIASLCTRDIFRRHCTCPPFGGEKFYFTKTWKTFMLYFEHFWQCTPELYPQAPPFRISKYATALDILCVVSNLRSSRRIRCVTSDSFFTLCCISKFFYCTTFVFASDEYRFNHFGSHLFLYVLEYRQKNLEEQRYIEPPYTVRSMNISVLYRNKRLPSNFVCNCVW